MALLGSRGDTMPCPSHAAHCESLLGLRGRTATVPDPFALDLFAPFTHAGLEAIAGLIDSQGDRPALC